MVERVPAIYWFAFQIHVKVGAWCWELNLRLPCGKQGLNYLSCPCCLPGYVWIGSESPEQNQDSNPVTLM